MKHFYDYNENTPVLIHKEDDNEDTITCSIPAKKILYINYNTVVFCIQCPYCLTRLNMNMSPRKNAKHITHNFVVQNPVTPYEVEAVCCREHLLREYRNKKIVFEIHSDKETCLKVKKTSKSQLDACKRFYQRKKIALQNNCKSVTEACEKGILERL